MDLEDYFAQIQFEQINYWVRERSHSIAIASLSFPVAQKLVR
ncbi:hypothetical protein [uncultured Nostoc sp.]